MEYQYPLYNIFNQTVIETQLRQRHHNEQIIKSMDCVNKLKEFLESIDKVESDYQNIALEQCCILIVNYMKIHGIL